MTVYHDIEDLHTAIVAMQRSLATLEGKRDLARSRYEELDVKCRDMGQAITGLQGEMSLLRRGAPDVDSLPAVDLTGCTNMGQRLHRIAMSMGGEVDISNVLDIIVGAGATNAKRGNIRSVVQRWIRAHAGDWEHVAPGTYRYLRLGEGDEEEH